MPDELVQAVFFDSPNAVGIGVAAMISFRRSSVQRDFEADWLAILRRAQHQVQIASMKPKQDCLNSICAPAAAVGPFNNYAIFSDSYRFVSCC